MRGRSTHDRRDPSYTRDRRRGVVDLVYRGPTVETAENRSTYMDAKEFAEKANQLREKLGTTAAVAKELKCHPKSLDRYKAGKRIIPSDIADKLRALVNTQ